MASISPRKAKKFFKAKIKFTLGPMELNDMLRRNADICVIDMRTPKDYANGHIRRAVNLPKKDWKSCSGLCKDKVNIIYCYSEACKIAAAAASDFSAKGYRVVELQGGFEAWRFYDLPVERSPRFYPLPDQARVRTHLEYRLLKLNRRKKHIGERLVKMFSGHNLWL